MAYTPKAAVAFLMSTVLILFSLIALAQILPYAWKYMTEGPDGVNYTLSDVPGGALLTGFGVFMIVFALIIGLVIKALLASLS